MTTSTAVVVLLAVAAVLLAPPWGVVVVVVADERCKTCNYQPFVRIQTVEKMCMNEGSNYNPTNLFGWDGSVSQF